MLKLLCLKIKKIEKLLIETLNTIKFKNKTIELEGVGIRTN